MSGKLRVLSFGFAVGLTTAIGMFLMGILAWQFSVGIPVVTLMSSMYIGYAPTLIGSFIGAGCGFIDGFFGGLLIALIYNCCCGCKNKIPD
ncbi:MAG TPA: bacteriophage holin [Gammaproteobacteria bacterium]|nr:bacteriophage holin [Gammaproteobacteria bacterium]